MDSVFRVRRNTTERSGGKILRGRRAILVPSPYTRPPSPPPSPNAPTQSPNWLRGFLSPAAKAILGAGKFVSNAFFPDSPPSSSSSSSSSEGDGSDHEDSSSEGVDASDQNATVPEVNSSQNEAQAITVIERLLMQETFSRDECDRLVKIIKSRTMEFPATKEGGDSRQSEFAAALENHTPDVRHTAVMEARKWLEEKKAESYSYLGKSEGTCTSIPSMLPNVTEGQAGSPVLVAKSYMKARPPWASPTLSHTGFQPSPVRMHLFKEDTPHSFGVNSLSSSKVTKRGSLDFDSWNNLDATRRVRFKSAEDSETLFSSEHIDSSMLEFENKGSKDLAEPEIRGGELNATTHDSNSSPPLGSVNVPFSENLVTSGILMHGGPGTQAPSSGYAILTCDRSQDLEDARMTTGEGSNLVSQETLDPNSSLEKPNGPIDPSAEMATSEPNLKPSDEIKSPFGSDCSGLLGVNYTHQPSMQSEGMQVNNSSQPSQLPDATSPLDNHSTEGEANRSKDTGLANGCPLSTGLLTELNAESSQKLGNEGQATKISPSESKLAAGIPLEHSCELLSEASVEVPVDDDADSTLSGSLDSSGRHSELLWPSKRGAKTRSSPRIEKQVAKKLVKYSKRGRGRGQ